MADGNYRISKPVARFRWARPPSAGKPTPRLQQAHEYIEYDASGKALRGGEEWHDVPTVIVDDLKPAGTQ